MDSPVTLRDPIQELAEREKRFWPYNYNILQPRTFTRFEPQTVPKRVSYPKETRQTPVDQLESQLKDLGVLPFESDNIPHLEMSLPAKQAGVVVTKKRGKIIRVNKKPIGRAVHAKAQPQVSMASGQYPTMQDSSRDSLSVSAPTSRTSVSRSGRPNLQYLPNGDCRIRHREFLSDITGSTALSITPFQVNPGLAGTFPWLSRIAGNYESYQFEMLKFSYGTEASTASTGSLIMSLDYDPTDSAPTTKMQALAYRGAVRSAPWAPCCHTSIRPDLSKRKSYYVRAGGLQPGLDVSLYDTGNLYVMVIGQGASTIIGELWVEYDIRLMTPRALSAGGGNAVWGRWNSGVDNVLPFVPRDGNLPASLAITGTTTSVSTWTFSQPWQGSIGVYVEGTTLASMTFSGTAAVGATQSTVVNTAQTNRVGRCEINAVQGQTLILTIANATLIFASTAFSGVWFTQGFGAYQ